MAVANEELLDLQIRHQVNLLRYSNAVVRKIIALLNRTDSDLVAQMIKRDPTDVSAGWSRQRLEAMLTAIREINRDAYSQVGQELKSELKGIAGYESEFQRKALSSGTVGFDVISPSAEQLRAAVLARPFQGKLLKEWVKDLDAASFARLRDQIRIGFVQGETIEQMIRRVRGTRALAFKDGILEISRRSAATMTRTAVAETAHYARDLLYAENADLIKGVQWVATLDTRTCVRCGSLDGEVFPLNKGPRPPLHFNCRCSTTPVTKSWKELGINLEEAPPGTRASMNGQVPAKMTYQDWLEKQNQKTQDDILGPSKAALFRAGGLKVDDFVDASKKELNLDQLKKAESKAFEKAGLNNPIKPPRGTPQEAIAEFLDDPAAQRSLLTKLMVSTASHRAVVTQAIEQQSWDVEPEPLMAIRHYTGSAFAKINARMRAGGETLEDRQFTALAAKGVEKLPDPEDVAWRAPGKNATLSESWWSRAVEGEPIDLGNQLQSFSKSAEFSAVWAGDGDVLFRLAKPKGGAYIERITQNRGEHEILLPPGQKYRVVSKRVMQIAGRDFRVIDLEIIDG